jgi:hypothetical protein
MSPHASGLVPRVVWMLWFQGWDDAPPLVEACLRSWREHNPGWEVRTLDDTSVDELGLLPTGFVRARLSLAAYSDLIRIELLRREGGIWADATTYCQRPLDTWIDTATTTGFFAFRRPAPGLELSSWFLAASPGHYLVSRWAEAARSYWSDRDATDDYMWFHHLFGQLRRDDERFDAAWRAVPRISANGPHYFVPYDPRLTRPAGRRALSRLASRTDPLYKLTHKIDLDAAHERSAYAVLTGKLPLPDAAGPALAVDRSWEAVRWPVRYWGSVVKRAARRYS